MKVLITGASSGIGQSMAIQMAAQGHQIVAVARNEERLNELKRQISCETVQMDLSNPDNCKMLSVKYPDVDVLINNAGFGYIGSFDGAPLERELEMVDTNIKALHILTKCFLIQMEKREKGYILNVGSIAGFMPGPNMVTYYASKAYVVRFTQGIAQELKGKGSNVYIGALCPGPVSTRFNATAGCDFRAKSRSSDSVAAYAIKKMWKRKTIIVPGLSTKVIRFATKICSDSFMAKMASRVQTKKVGAKMAQK